jgi:hypothetical protein
MVEGGELSVAARMKTSILMPLVTCVASLAFGQDQAKTGSVAGVPKGYVVGTESVSPNGRFAILYPVRGDNDADLPPNLLVCLAPYAVLTTIGTEGGRWEGARGQPLARWYGNSLVAIWVAQKWGIEDLAIYEIERDAIKRIQPVWRQVRLLFDRDFKERFLKNYPDEKGSGVIFVSQADVPDSKPEFEFKGRTLLLNLFADNKPNLSTTPHWTASLHAVWNLDKVDFDKVDFRPGPIELRPEE